MLGVAITLFYESCRSGFQTLASDSKATPHICSDTAAIESDDDSNASLRLPTPSYQELVNNPDCYNGAIIRLKANLYFGEEGIYFNDETLGGMSHEIAGEVIGMTHEDFTRAFTEMCGERCVSPFDVVVVGKFETVTPSNELNTPWDTDSMHFKIIRLEKVSNSH
jgi:hypothetical protein